MGIGIGRLFPWEMGFKPLGLGFSHWEWEKNVKNQKWEWDLRIAKWDLEKNELGNGLVTHPSGTSTKLHSHIVIVSF